VIPRLRVLIAVALDADMLIHDHYLDVAAALLLLGYDGLRLIFTNIPEPVEMLLALGRQRGEQLVCNHFVGAALHREKLALICGSAKAKQRGHEIEKVPMSGQIYQDIQQS